MAKTPDISMDARVLLTQQFYVDLTHNNNNKNGQLFISRNV